MPEINEKNVLEDATFDYIFSVTDPVERRRIKTQCAEIAKKSRKKAKFLLVCDEYEKTHKVEESDFITSRITHFFGGKRPELNCGEWMADLKKGIYKYKETKKGIERIEACPTAVYINRRLKNTQGESEKVEIRFVDGKSWVTIKPKREIIANSRRIVELSAFGLPVTSENAKNLVSYFGDLFALNKIPVAKSSGKLGWKFIKDKDDNRKIIFSPYDRDVVFDADASFNDVYAAMRPKGSFDEWKKLFKSVILQPDSRIETKMMVAASVASVLVQPVGANSFITHLYGQTEGGKTVAMMVAASIWGNPDPRAAFLGDFMTTKTALEARANLFNNIPLFIDDSAKTSRSVADRFDDIIYTLCSGRGKDRSNIDIGLATSRTWHSGIITTGEHPIVSESSQGGAANRVQQVKVDFERIFRDGHYVAELVKHNYGWAGPRVIEFIKSKGFDYIRAEYQKAYDELKVEKMEKQAQSAALLLVGYMVLIESVFPAEGLPYLTPSDIRPFLRSETEITEEARAYAYVHDLVVQHRSFFYDNNNSNSTQVWGRIDGNYVCFVPSVLREQLSLKGYSVDTFVAWCRSKHILDCESGRLTKKRTIEGHQQRCYVIDMYSIVAQQLMGEAKADDIAF